MEYMPHENTFLSEKRNHKWLKSYKGQRSRKARRALTGHFHYDLGLWALDDFLALKGLMTHS